MDGSSLSVLLNHQEDFLNLNFTDIAATKFIKNQFEWLVVLFAHYLLNSLVVHQIHSRAKNRHALTKQLALTHLLQNSADYLDNWLRSNFVALKELQNLECLLS